jgi:hypothetical protein
VALEIAMPQPRLFSGLRGWEESAECNSCTGQAFEHKQLQRRDALAKVFCCRQPRIICSFSS